MTSAGEVGTLLRPRTSQAEGKVESEEATEVQSDFQEDLDHQQMISECVTIITLYIVRQSVSPKCT